MATLSVSPDSILQLYLFHPTLSESLLSTGEVPTATLFVPSDSIGEPPKHRQGADCGPTSHELSPRLEKESSQLAIAGRTDIS